MGEEMGHIGGNDVKWGGRGIINRSGRNNFQSGGKWGGMGETWEKNEIPIFHSPISPISGGQRPSPQFTLSVTALTDRKMGNSSILTLTATAASADGWAFDVSRVGRYCARPAPPGALQHTAAQHITAHHTVRHTMAHKYTTQVWARALRCQDFACNRGPTRSSQGPVTIPSNSRLLIVGKLRTAPTLGPHNASMPRPIPHCP